jgi:hypothetical protein
MKKLMITLLAVAISSCAPLVPAKAANDMTVKIDKNNRVTVKEHGITKDYGSVRKVEKSYDGKTKIYTNRNFNSAAIEVDRSNNIRTQERNISKSSSCSYSCALIEDDE